MTRVQPRVARRLGWCLTFAFSAVAVVRAATAPGPVPAAPLSVEQAHRAYEALTAKEPEFRAKAAENFAADAWSRDDDFSASERGLAASWASDHGVRRQDVFGAIDQGMRGHWLLPPDVPQPGTRVAPCKPRAME